MDPKQINKMQRVQNLLKKGRENLNRSRSELGDHNRKILQQLTRHRSDFGEQNKRLLASFRMKRSEAGKIIPYSFSKIRQDEDLRVSQKTSLDKNKIEDVFNNKGMLEDSQAEDFDLLTTVLAEFDSRNVDAGICDMQSSLEENSQPLDQNNIRILEMLSESCDIKKQSLSSNNDGRNNLSENLCDEIFNELEKNSTFPKLKDRSLAHSSDQRDTISRSLLQYIDEELCARGHSIVSGQDGGQYHDHSTLRITDNSSHNSNRRRSSGSESSDMSAAAAGLSVLNLTGSPRSRHRSLSDSRAHEPRSRSQTRHSNGSSSPHAPPRRRDRTSSQKRTTSPPKATSNGLPPTPKVHMGACFSKVFNGCPLKINCTASWVHPETRNQHILVGAEEGIYTLNLNELHENVMDLLYPRRTVWMFVIKDVLMTLSGKTPSLFRHDLIGLHANSKQSHRFTISVNAMTKIPEKFVPKKYSMTSKVPETKGTTKCCVGRNPYNGYKYLCGALPGGVFLMQWYDPLNKFMLLKHFECSIANPPRVFEMIITPDLEYPIVCVNVRRGYDGRSLKLDMINLNSSSSWFHSDELEEQDGTQTVIPRHELMNIVSVTQLEKDTILVAYDNVVKVVNLQGKLKSSKRQASELHFDFTISYIVCLADSVLAFHKQGMQGRSFKNNEVTQEICDKSRIFKLVGSDRIITIQSSPDEEARDKSATLTPETGDNGVNLYILAGHEAMQL